jgi:hypothetical protein
MTVKGTLAVAVVLLAIWLMYGHHPAAAPVHHPIVHTTAHHPARKG